MRADRIKKDHDLVTFAEISAYIDGRPVDRASAVSIRSRSLRGRPWDKAIHAALSIVLFLVIGALIGYAIAALTDLLAQLFLFLCASAVGRIHGARDTGRGSRGMIGVTSVLGGARCAGFGNLQYLWEPRF